MHPLDGARLKTQRAKAHLNGFHRRYRRFVSLNPYHVIENDDAEPPNTLYYLEGQATPTEWGAIIGDIVGNLRSALDYIAWELSTSSGKPVPEKRERGIQFPILDAPNKGRFHQAAEFMTDAAKAVVESFQPYPNHRAQWSDLELLWLLNELSRIDKHRIITQTFPRTLFRITRAGHYADVGLKQGHTIILPPGSAITGDTQLKPQFSLDIGFDIAGHDARATRDGLTVLILDDMHDFIRDQVIPRFVGLFPQ